MAVLMDSDAQREYIEPGRKLAFSLTPLAMSSIALEVSGMPYNVHSTSHKVNVHLFLCTVFIVISVLQDGVGFG